MMSCDCTDLYGWRVNVITPTIFNIILLSTPLSYNSSLQLRVLYRGHNWYFVLSLLSFLYSFPSYPSLNSSFSHVPAELMRRRSCLHDRGSNSVTQLLKSDSVSAFRERLSVQIQTQCADTNSLNVSVYSTRQKALTYLLHAAQSFFRS